MDQFSTPQKTPTRSILKEINSNEFANKSGAAAHGSIKSPLGLDSDISGIDADNTLSGLDTTVDTSYKIENPNATFGDLISGFSGLKLDTSQCLSKANNYDTSNTLSSDDELFQECENGFEMDATTVVPESTEVTAHSSNIDHNVFDKTINFSSIAANSTANLANSTANSTVNLANSTASLVSHIPELSMDAEKSDILFKSSIANQTIQSESISSTHASSCAEPNVTETAVEATENESFVKPLTEDTQVVEQFAGIEAIAQENVANITENNIENITDEIELQQSGIVAISNDTHSPEELPTQVNDSEVPENPINIEIPRDGNGNQLREEQPQTVNENPTKLNETNVLEPAEKTIILEDEQNPVNNLNDTINLTTELTGNVSHNDIQVSINSSDAASEQIELEKSLNVTTYEVNQTVQIESEMAYVQANITQDIDDEVKPSEIAPEQATPVADTAAANQTFEAMDVDMNETVNLQQPTTNQFDALNQTVEMADLDQADEVTESDLNVTATVTNELNEPKPTFNEPTSPVQISQAIGFGRNGLNMIQELSEEPRTKVELNQTIDISSSKMNVTPTNQDNCVNDTFVKSNSPSLFNQTHNVSKDFLSSTRHVDMANNTSPSLPNVNLNETIVVDNKLPSINTSFIVSPMAVESESESKTVDFKQISAEPMENTFKLPAKPSKASNPFDHKHAQVQFEVSDDEFQAPGLILNSNDFDFLLSRGSNTGQNNPRDSILERFDPISGRKSIVTPIIKPDQIPVSLSPSISTILEVDSINETLIEPAESVVSVKQVPVSESNVTVTERGDNEEFVKLESSEHLKRSFVGDGDCSQASSSSETYETASVGEPLKAEVTMSIGLIHDHEMDNMKSLEQDKVEPNLKMNDEHKVKQEMVGDIERKLKEAEAREEALLRRITEKEKAMNKMNAVVENYEKTMVELISEREQLTQNYEKQLLQLKGERDANLHHLTSLENTFSDLHVKYEKSKNVAIEVKDSEAKLVEKLEFCQQQMKLQEQRYDKLKNHALSQLEGANAKLEALNKAHSNDMKKLTAQLKKEEISRQSTIEQLAQKTKENDELVKICDELINNGGDGS